MWDVSKRQRALPSPSAGVLVPVAVPIVVPDDVLSQSWGNLDLHPFLRVRYKP